MSTRYHTIKVLGLFSPPLKETLPKAAGLKYFILLYTFLNTVKGLEIPFMRRTKPILTQLEPQNKVLFIQGFQDLLRKGAFQNVAFFSQSFYGRMLLVPKKEYLYRPLVDLQVI